MSSEKVGALVLEQEIGQGETLGDLLARLEHEHHQAWQDILDAQTGEIRPIVLTIVNGTLLSRPVASQTRLSDGDQIAFRIAYSGG
jgi:molybdopterin converting factor small subunit